MLSGITRRAWVPYNKDAIRELKDRTEGGLHESGSGTFVRAILADGLIDELHLFVFPLTVGTGPRLFPERQPAAKFTLGRSEAYENGVLYLVYRRIG
jgi:dihydrofolate reductase